MALLMATCVLGTAQAKKKVLDFSEFEGNYKAQPTTLALFNSSYPASVGMIVKVSKSGKSAVIAVNGSLTALGTVYPLSGTFTLQHNTISVDDVLFHINNTTTGGATGPLTLNRKGNRIAYTMTFATAPSVSMNGTIAVSPQGKTKKKLTLLFQIDGSGTHYSFPFIGVAKIKASK